MFLLFTSFVSGVLTVLTPCVLPVLPIILGGSMNDKANKKVVVIGSFIISIVLFTLLLKFFSIFANVPENFWQYISGSLIIFLGLTFLFPNLWNKVFLHRALKNTGEKINSLKNNTKSVKTDFWKNILTGLALGPIFSSCSPTYFLILATVLPVSLYLGIVYLFAYAVGLGFALFLISAIGDKLLNKIEFINTNMFKIIIGVLFVIVGVLIFTGLNKELEIEIRQPEVVKNIEGQLLNAESAKEEKKQILVKKESIKIMPAKVNEENKIVFENFGTAPELVGIVDYINVNEGTTLKEILSRNKVVMLEFWTYSCINCKRTLPYVNDWYTKYHSKGFEIVGVHTPEFAFEKVRENVVKNSIAQGVQFPIFMDNDYATWNAYNNQYWPMRILIIPGPNGTNKVIYKHAGEGDYANNEAIIKQIVEN
jgi:cytochrome c biogenesis protein CcdA/thiol-disulfide isomerase/thioredoxin